MTAAGQVQRIPFTVTYRDGHTARLFCTARFIAALMRAVSDDRRPDIAWVEVDTRP